MTAKDFIPYRAEIDLRHCYYFIRGDFNLDNQLNIADAVANLSYLFASGPRPRCAEAADTNDGGQINIGDPVRLLCYLFNQQPLPPGTTPGMPQEDPTPDNLGCDAAVGTPG